MSHRHGYRAHVEWTGAAGGPTTSYTAYSRDFTTTIEGKPPLAGSADRLFRGDPSRHNPEDLLVAALSSCHLLSYLALAARGGVTVLAYEDDASGELAIEGNGGHFTEVVLRPRVTIAPDSDAARAQALHVQAHADCYLASSMSFPVRIEAETLVREGAAPAGR